MAYVIIEKDTEYNDEIYEQLEYGKPKLIIADKDKAVAKCKELNALAFSGAQLFEYAYSPEEILSRRYDFDEAKEELKDILPDLNADDYHYMVPTNLTLEQYMKVAQVFSRLSFFDLYETEVDGEIN